MLLPNSFAFSANDKRLTYLLGSGTPPAQHLHALEVATGATSVLVAPPGGGTREDTLSPEEELRRQRARMLAIGLTHYSLAARGERILVPLQGCVYVQDGPGAPLRQIVNAARDGAAETPALSPDGRSVAYVHDAEVYVIAAVGGKPRQLTRGAHQAGVTHGLAEFVVQEEFARAEGFWWSPDGRALAFEEVDERHIPLYHIVHQGKDATGPEAEEAHRYPFAGAANAHVRLGVVARRGGAPVWMDLDYGEEVYLARVFWWPDGRLGAVIPNREQTTVEVVAFDPATGARTRILRETSKTWINVPDRRALVTLQDGRFLWPSERDGFRHLYLFERDGKLVRQLTDGAWVVDEIEAVDERDGLVYFSGNREHPTERHLYVVPLAGGAARRLTPEAGTHAVTLDHACQRFVDVWSALDQPPRVALRSTKDGAVLHPMPVPADPRVARFHLEPPELVTLRSRDGAELHGAVYRPPARFGPGPHPTIVHVYGGPHAQMVKNDWSLTAALQMQYLRQLGYLIFRLDNRGSARRGMAFEAPIRHRLGHIEVDDQVDGVRWLVARGLTDAARVGVTGWSYGGYMTLRCLELAPDVFKVGVSGAPVTDQAGYDTAYTERYMGTPQSNAAGYAASSVLAAVNTMRGHLLLVHGLLDENVHFRHTARLINALNRARKPYDLLIFPDERHMPRHQSDRVYLNERVIGYFQQHL
jgi:dipeptidyl-peptidase-4